MSRHPYRRPLLLSVAALAMLLGSSLSVLALPNASHNDGAVAQRSGVHVLTGDQGGQTTGQIRDLTPNGGRDPQRIVGSDGRIQVTDTTQDPYRKIVQLIAISQDQETEIHCSGAFIGERVVMTAAHCLWSPALGGWANALKVTPGKNGDDQPFGTDFASTVWVPRLWIDSLSDGDSIPDWDADYGLAVMESASLGSSVGAMTIGVLDDAELAADDFNATTAGYPGDKPMGTQWMGTEPAFSTVTTKHLYHAIDSWSGQSGSPLWRGSDELVVGIESVETDAENVSRRLTQAVVEDFEAVCEELDCDFNVYDGGNQPPPPTGGGEPPVARPSDPNFERVWNRTDKPVADGQATRTWMWGPQANSQVVLETYDEAPGGERAVQYYDKSRMEITDPNTDPNSIWFVTNGLLATEMISGQMQLGNDHFEDRGAAIVNVAGDANDPNGPTYATFSGLLTASAQPVGATLTERVGRDGQVTNDPGLSSEGVTIGYVDDITNHGIAAPFWSFMNSSGTVYEDGAFVSAPLFDNAFFATGRPITEPYWANVLVGGADRLVLMQCFERRCLTYTPGNPEGFVVEMSNSGQHYYAWRYQQDDESPPPASDSVDVCLNDAELELLLAIGAYREENGRATFVNSAALNVASYEHSLDMGTRGYLDHMTPEGVGPTQRAQAAGYEGSAVENIAVSEPNALDVLEVWTSSMSNNFNLLSENVAIGIGQVFVEGSEWGWYWTVKFGDVVDATPTNCD